MTPGEIAIAIFGSVFCVVFGARFYFGAEAIRANWVGIVEARLDSRWYPRRLVLWQLRGVRSRAFVRRTRLCGVLMMLLAPLCLVLMVVKLSAVLPPEFWKF